MGPLYLKNRLERGESLDVAFVNLEMIGSVNVWSLLYASRLTCPRHSHFLFQILVDGIQ